MVVSKLDAKYRRLSIAKLCLNSCAFLQSIITYSNKKFFSWLVGITCFVPMSIQRRERCCEKKEETFVHVRNEVSSLVLKVRSLDGGACAGRAWITPKISNSPSQHEYFTARFRELAETGPRRKKPEDEFLPATRKCFSINYACICSGARCVNKIICQPNYRSRRVSNASASDFSLVGFGNLRLVDS